ncbi:MAG TPA: sigma 54-interacting transcriptional regulator [Bacteroidota bacterium]|nr:sigma 54-interacting transcriptional regulator [Bacteroidota bacterium]
MHTTTVIEQSYNTTMSDVLRAAHDIAETDLPMLIVGEPGTGKTWLARRIHLLSPRTQQKFLEFSPHTLRLQRIEQQFFGVETSPATNRIGILERVKEGTLFLRHVSYIPLDLQSRIATTIETRQFQRRGGKETLAVHARIIGSLCRRPRELVDEGILSPDIYRLFSPAIITIPPLRKRKEDIPSLIDKFVLECNGLHGTRVKRVSAECLHLCIRYTWPGNVRELRNAIRYACLLCVNDIVRPKHLPAFLLECTTPQSVEATPQLMSVATAERALIEKTLRYAATKRDAARILGISLKTLYNKINKYALQDRFINSRGQHPTQRWRHN